MPARTFGYTFPAIRGIQAGREYYVSMCPLRLIPKIFLFNEEELVPELRAQRTLNRARIPEISRYILANRHDYTFSALTASIDGEAQFQASDDREGAQLLGSLHVAMDARFVINDGQHRRAAIEAAIRENSDLADESIAVVFFVDAGLNRCQQMFADLNRYAVRPSPSLGVLYDHRDLTGVMLREWIVRHPVFRELTEMERTTLSARSRKLFTLSALYHATMALIGTIDQAGLEDAHTRVRAYWSEVLNHFPSWGMAALGQLAAAEIRRDAIHSHGTALHALGRLGAALLEARPRNWKSSLKALQRIDWSRHNTALWEGRAMIGGRVSKSGTNVILVTNVLKRELGLPLTEEEQRVEDAYSAHKHD
ncbi:MAG: DNA sulfur modification protein DndB [Dyella sp.]|uniref:DNA sulfur modification protein DndB n=1 Tax=Dyella sp. TaxID=1869338 RepID=UPI003F80CAF6